MMISHFSTRIGFMMSALCAVVIMSACSSSSGNDPVSGGSTSTSGFTFRLTDNTQYQNSTGASFTATGTTSRTVRQLNFSVPAGVSPNPVFPAYADAVFLTDTNRTTAGAISSVDTLIMRRSGTDLFIYNFARQVAGLLPPISLGGATVVPRPLPSWTKIAELNNAAGTPFVADTLRFAINIPFSGTLLPATLWIVLNGQNTGNSTVTVGGTSYSVFRQSHVASLFISLGAGTTPLAATGTIPIEVLVGGVSGASNSPSTILRIAFSPASSVFDLSAFGAGVINFALPGYRQELTAFRQGQ